MGITPLCDCCGKVLDDFGAIVLSPPSGHDVKKYHVCVACYQAKVEPLLGAVGGGGEGFTLRKD